MAGDPIKAVCHRTFYPAFRSSGVRPVSAIKWIVMHDTEGGTARSVARFFKGPFSGDDGGSTHLVVDDFECQRCLLDVAVPWGARSASKISANFHGLHIEQCGRASWSTEQWLEHERTLKRGAYKAALHCFKFGIPPIFVTAPGLLAGREGVTTHNEITQASKAADPANAWKYDHTDPGTGWPRALFMKWVRAFHTDLVELMPE